MASFWQFFCCCLFLATMVGGKNHTASKTNSPTKAAASSATASSHHLSHSKSDVAFTMATTPPDTHTKSHTASRSFSSATQMTTTAVYDGGVTVTSPFGQRAQLDVLTRVLGSQAVVTAIYTTSTTAVALSGIVNPTGVTQLLRANIALDLVVNCAFSDDEEELEPSYLELPIQVRLGADNFALYVGSYLVCIATFVLAPAALHFAVRLVLSKRQQHPALQRTTLFKLQNMVVSTFLFLGVAYFGPTTFKLLAMVSLHDEVSPTSIAVIATCAVIVVALMGAYVFYTVQSKPADPAASSDEASSESTSKVDVASFAQLYDGARFPGQLSCRLYFFEDVAVTSGFMFIDGSRPREGSCKAAAGGMIALAAIHVLYLALRRPYDNRLELVTSMMVSLLLLVISITSGVMAIGEPTDAALDSLGTMMLVESIFVFLQATVLALQAYVIGQKKKVLARQAAAATASTAAAGPPQVASSSSSDSDDDEGLGQQLLKVPNSANPAATKKTTASQSPLSAATLNPLNTIMPPSPPPAATARSSSSSGKRRKPHQQYVGLDSDEDIEMDLRSEAPVLLQY